MSRSAMFWVQLFVGVQMSCQLALLVPQLGAARVVFRTVAFVVSLFALAFAPGRRAKHPSHPFAWLVIVILGLSLANPYTNGFSVGIAQNLLYLSIIAPLFWVSRLGVDRRVLLRLVRLYWSFQSLSVLVGILQVYFPGQFEFQLTAAYDETNPILEGLQVTLANGTKVWRPMGLTDVPGGAGVSGLYVAMFSLGYLSLADRWWLRAVAIPTLVAGLFCILLSQVRSLLIILGVCAGTYLVALLLTRRIIAAVRVSVVLPVVALVGFTWASVVGGEQMVKRFESLSADDAGTVYGRNRGEFLENAFTNYLPEYPLGAGLGRWGMTRVYFGDETNPASPPLWVEIQWEGWILDGGIPLLMAYTLAMLVAIGETLRTAFATPRDREVGGWAVLMFAYGIAVLANTFSYSPFIGQSGLDFWLLTTCVWSVGRSELGLGVQR